MLYLVLILDLKYITTLKASLPVFFNKEGSRKQLFKSTLDKYVPTIFALNYLQPFTYLVSKIDIMRHPELVFIK